MDNLSAHKSAGIENIIAEVGADLWYLPAYSPDMNPIEKFWSKIKACLRLVSANTVEGLLEAAGQALGAVTPAECRNYFALRGIRI